MQLFYHGGGIKFHQHVGNYLRQVRSAFCVAWANWQHMVCRQATWNSTNWMSICINLPKNLSTHHVQ